MKQFTTLIIFALVSTFLVSCVRATHNRGKSRASKEKVLTGKEIYNKYNSAVFVVTTDRAQGSGFFISSNGEALSNYHVIEKGDINSITIKTTDGRTYHSSQISIISYSKNKDYVRFKVNASKRFNYIPMAPEPPEIGEKVFAIGSPLGLENTFSEGSVSNLNSNDVYPIQINAPIDHGSSGGALINQYGQAIGITSAGYNSNANLNFAVDIHDAR